MGPAESRHDYLAWFARLAVAALFALNVQCAVAVIARPRHYVQGFDLSGVPGEAAVRGLGIAFLMWNYSDAVRRLRRRRPPTDGCSVRAARPEKNRGLSRIGGGRVSA